MGDHDSAPIEKLVGRRVAVVVLADLARSPRMLGHALELRRAGASVTLVGLMEGELPRVVTESGTRTRLLTDRRTRESPGLYAFKAASDLAKTSVQLGAQLRDLRPDLVLVQSPPSQHLLPWIFESKRRGARLAVDWHNLGSSRSALRFGATHPIPRALALSERALSRLADAQVAVSSRLLSAVSVVGVPSVVLHDRPMSWYRRSSISARESKRTEILATFDAKDDGGLLVVTSTSFGPDEDFELLEGAIRRLEAAGASAGKVRVLITGRGPGMDEILGKLTKACGSRAQVRNVWLSAEDLAETLSAADVGLSLHRSSSGLDLPMKIQDMVGAGLPVLALDFAPVLLETFRVGVDGLLFTSSAELCELLDRGRQFMSGLRKFAEAAPKVSWSEAWRASVGPLLGTLCSSR
ncbi:MAG: glycosyltransferase [Deltaproteobacteria bacterium]|nr:glycosyltransferase [Deltaproteobacteria bacterium]